MNTPSTISFVFFGSSHFSVRILEELEKNNLRPTLVVTSLDKPTGRKLVMTAPEAKLWAEARGVPCLQLAGLKTPEAEEKIKNAVPEGFDVGIVASYGKIIPQNILDIPRREMLNIHVSLLPKLRGASPMQSAILGEKETGVTIIHMDFEMDHGAIVAQKKFEVGHEIPEWPPYEETLEEASAIEGTKLLVEILPDWLSGKASEIEQIHAEATFCGKIKKEDGEIHLSDDAESNLRKIRAYHIWPGAFFFETHKGKRIRIIVKKAHIETNTETQKSELVLDRVVPEGKKEMSYTDFKNGLK